MMKAYQTYVRLSSINLREPPTPSAPKTHPNQPLHHTPFRVRSTRNGHSSSPAATQNPTQPPPSQSFFRPPTNLKPVSITLDRHSFPFTAIVGQESMKLALILNAVVPTIGGDLIGGEKGTGKSTAVRALARLL